jgi:hypothetical protein
MVPFGFGVSDFIAVGHLATRQFDNYRQSTITIPFTGNMDFFSFRARHETRLGVPYRAMPARELAIFFIFSVTSRIFIIDRPTLSLCILLLCFSSLYVIRLNFSQTLSR